MKNPRKELLGMECSRHKSPNICPPKQHDYVKTHMNTPTILNEDFIPVTGWTRSALSSIGVVTNVLQSRNMIKSVDISHSQSNEEVFSIAMRRWYCWASDSDQTFFFQMKSHRNNEECPNGFSEKISKSLTLIGSLETSSLTPGQEAVWNCVTFKVFELNCVLENGFLTDLFAFDSFFFSVTI